MQPTAGHRAGHSCLGHADIPPPTVRDISLANELLRTVSARRSALARIVAKLRQQVVHEVGD